MSGLLTLIATLGDYNSNHCGCVTEFSLQGASEALIRRLIEKGRNQGVLFWKNPEDTRPNFYRCDTLHNTGGQPIPLCTLMNWVEREGAYKLEQISYHGGPYPDFGSEKVLVVFRGRLNRFE